MNRKFYVVLASGLLVLFLFMGALLARTGSREGSYNYLSILSNVIHLVDNNYVEPVDFHKAMDSALNGMVENLDPESFFLKGSELEEYKKLTAESKSSGSVGLTLSKRYGMIVVIAVEKNSSAAENKIKAGDVIRSVNDQYVQNLPLYRIYHLLDGPSGTQVKVSTFENALQKPQEYTLVRRNISRPYIESYVAQPRIGYVRLAHLRAETETEVANKLKQFDQQGISKLVLDLRGCTEENQEVAVKIADLFLGETPILQISNREGAVRKISGDKEISYRGELLVLADYTTAGGAEIIAAALQDNGAGQIMGVRTFGRGGIQKLIPAGSDYIYLTVEKYLTPKGKTILSNGVEPAIKYEQDVKSAQQKEDSDPLLEKALEQLRYEAKEAA